MVSVEVAGGRIQKIEILEHRTLLGKKAEREIPSRVLRAQSVQVDTVTRATASSMVILKAIEIALTRKPLWATLLVGGGCGVFRRGRITKACRPDSRDAFLN